MALVTTFIDGIWYARNMQWFHNQHIDGDIISSMATTTMYEVRHITILNEGEWNIQSDKYCKSYTRPKPQQQ
jgi:hypothetical protein